LGESGKRWKVEIKLAKDLLDFGKDFGGEIKKKRWKAGP